MNYNFAEKLKEGEAFEDELDNYYKQTYRIKKADLEQQKRGIDRLFVTKSSNAAFTVEYKADSRTAETGNIFCEVAVNTEHSSEPGWVLKSASQALIYYIPQQRKALCCSMLCLKGCIEQWQYVYQMSKPVMNQNGDRKWWAIGLLVPLCEFEKAVVWRIDKL